MTSKDIASQLDSLSEHVVLLEAEDTEALETVRGLLENTLTWAENSAAEGVLAHATEACSLVAELLKHENSDPDAALERVSQAVSSIQSEFLRADREASLSSKTPVHEDAPIPVPGALKTYALPSYVNQAIFHEFIARQAGVLEELESSILELENSGSENVVSEIKRSIHTLKGESGLLAMVDVERMCHTIEDALADQEGKLLIDPLLAAKDWFGRAFAAYSDGSVPEDDGEKVIAALLSKEVAEGTPAEDSADSAVFASLTAELGELISGAAPNDIHLLAEIHTYLESLSLELNGASLMRAVDTVDAMADTVSQIILEEFDDPQSALDAIEGAIEGFSQASANGSSLDEVPFVFDALLRESKVDSSTTDTLLQTFLVDAREYVDTCSLHAVALESNGHDIDALTLLQYAFGGIAEEGEPLGFEVIAKVSSAMVEALKSISEMGIGVSDVFVDVVNEAIEFVSTRLAELQDGLDSGEKVSEVSDPTSLLAQIAESSDSADVPEDITQAKNLDHASVGKIGEILIEQGSTSQGSIDDAILKQMQPWAPLKLGQLVAEAGMATRSQINDALKIHNADPSRGHVGEVLIQSGVVTEAQLGELLDRQADPQEPPKIGEILIRTGEASAKDVVSALRMQKKGAGKAGKSVPRESVKVDSARLNALVDMIGELVIAETMVSLSEEMKNDISPGLTRNLSQLDKITRELQEMGTTLRMVPLRATFQKMARLVRDLAKKSGREVEFFTSGEETELDKTLVDKIGDPLVHMVRNAVDHGLEKTSEERRKAGKSAKGRIELRAFHKGGSIYVEIEDDGRGLDRDAILSKARAQDIIQNGDSLEDKEVWNLVFRPGFTTADKVTDVSGRGVGMDVVRRAVEEMRGSIDITSKAGRGSLFSLRLPLTLAIIDGMVIRCGAERYVLPTVSVMRLIRPAREDLTSVFVKEKLLKVAGRLVPLHFLCDLLQIQGDSDNVRDGVIIVVEYEDKLLALVVDEVLGQQQTVIKSLGTVVGNVPGISGGAILPDGRVGIILDVSGLTKLIEAPDAGPAVREKSARASEKL